MNKKNDMENSELSNKNYENIIQNLQYTNTLLNKRNISLEKELEIIKNKYNFCKQDLNDINKHISICKETQEKVIEDLKGRNNYLEKLYITKDNNNIKEDKENLKNKNIKEKLHSFVEKMKILFDYDLKEEINDEEYLDMFSNNIIKLNEEFLLNRNELNKKIHEINKLKNEIQNIKLNNNNIINNYIPNNYSRVKTPVGHSKNKLKYLNNNQNIQINTNEENSNSPKSFRIKANNNISIPKTPQINPETFNDISINKSKNKKINIEKKLINSHSLNSYKFRTLKESEKERKYIYPEENLNNNNKNLNSNDLIQSLMNNVKHLESTFNKRPNQK